MVIARVPVWSTLERPSRLSSKRSPSSASTARWKRRTNAAKSSQLFESWRGQKRIVHTLLCACVIWLYMEYPQSRICLSFLCSSGILVCTDVMARGIDIPDVHWVLQYDPPSSARFVNSYLQTSNSKTSLPSVSTGYMYSTIDSISYVWYMAYNT